MNTSDKTDKNKRNKGNKRNKKMNFPKKAGWLTSGLAFFASFSSKKSQKSGQGSTDKPMKNKATRAQKAHAAAIDHIHTFDHVGDDNYFQTARSWSDDIHAETVVSRNRYKVAFYSMSGLCALSIICIMMLIPLQSTQLVIVHEGANGYVWVSTAKADAHIKPNKARTRAELAHYVMTRESYYPEMYIHQTKEVSLLSSPAVLNEYELSQAQSNKLAAINLLGNKGYREVQINSIVSLDSLSQNQSGQKATHINLALVYYTLIDHFYGESKTQATHMMAKVSWAYDGVPDNPSAILNDYDGFKITGFSAQLSNAAN